MAILRPAIIQRSFLLTSRCGPSALPTFKASAGFHHAAIPLRSRASAPSFNRPLLGSLVGATIGRRFASTAYAIPCTQSMTPAKWRQLGLSVLAIGVGTVGLNMLLNRETRDALAPVERAHLNSTFLNTGAGLLIVTATAIAMHRRGLSLRIMQANPWLVIGGSLIGGIGSMMGVFATGTDKPIQKRIFWASFNAFQAMTLAPLLFLNPALLARAGLYTAGLVGSLSYIGATARQDQYLYIGGPLMAGLVLVCLSSFAPMILPATAVGTLAATEAISLYGGLAVFGGFVLFDTQKILAHARTAEQTGQELDPVAESISLELDFINIFIRMVMILSSGGSRRK